MSDYEILKATGHSPAKAAEILLDAQRGVPWALTWVAMMRRIHNGEV